MEKKKKKKKIMSRIGPMFWGRKNGEGRRSVIINVYKNYFIICSIGYDYCISSVVVLIFIWWVLFN